MKISQSIHELIAQGPLAHLTTINSKGGPQVTVVWVGIENEEFVIGHLATHQKVKNIRRDSRVALSMLGDKTNAQGLREYLVIYGNARVTEGGAVELIQRLARIYLGPKADFPPPPCAALRATSRESLRSAPPESGRGLQKPLIKTLHDCRFEIEIRLMKQVRVASGRGSLTACPSRTGS
jgi:PPOX class probable F420-dependent enzyme